MAYSVMSSVVSQQQATPAAKVSGVSKGAPIRTTYGYATVVATTAGQTNAFVRIPARAKIVGFRAENASMGDGALDFDLYRVDGTTRVTTAGSVLADFPLTGHSLEARVDFALSEANAAKTLEELFTTEIGTAGATGDAEFDLVGVVITVSTGTAVPVGLMVEYVLPE
jgi:hypothetical protein